MLENKNASREKMFLEPGLWSKKIEKLKNRILFQNVFTSRILGI